MTSTAIRLGSSTDLAKWIWRQDYTGGKEVWDAVADGSVDVVYNNHNSPGNADKAMKKLKPGGYYISIIGAMAKTPKAGVTQKQFLVNATRPRDLEILTALLEGGFVKPKVTRWRRRARHWLTWIKERQRAR